MTCLTWHRSTQGDLGFVAVLVEVGLDIGLLLLVVRLVAEGYQKEASAVFGVADELGEL